MTLPTTPATPTPATAGSVNASALIYNDQGMYLLHLRDHLPGLIWEPGAWSLLGGGHERQDASLEETIRRELREEAGLEVPELQPFAVEKAVSTDGHTTVDIQIFAGRWNGDPADLTLTEGVMLAWFPLETMPRLRMSPTLLEVVRRHAAQHTATAAPKPRPPASITSTAPELPAPGPSGTVLQVIGAHLYLENDAGHVLLGLGIRVGRRYTEIGW